MPKPKNNRKSQTQPVEKAKRQGLTRSSRLSQLANKPAFGRYYLLASFLILLLSAIFWSWLGARLQQANADQLVNPYLFEHRATFHQALIPATHSFLLKWPLFMLVALFGFSSGVLTTVTILCVVVTLACFVAGLALIERRPLVLGTLCLALASVLLLVPAQPHPGDLLPVNMAMLTTRNLEYALYIACLSVFAWRPRIRSWQFWLGVAGLTLLVASDKLFLYLTLGGALLALIAYALSSGWNLVSISVKWLLGGVTAGALASGLLWFINARHLTNIVNQTQTSPYLVVHNAHQLALGAAYTITGLVTNFGANPAFDTTVFRQMPSAAFHHLLSWGGPAFLINLVVLLAGIYAIWRLLRQSFAHNKNKAQDFGLANRVAILLIWSSLASVVMFALTSHYFAGDARYLTIWLFAVFVALAAFGQQRMWRADILVVIGIVLSLGIIGALPIAHQAYRRGESAQTPFSDRNSVVIEILKQHPVDVLVGDYWRVVPTKYAAHTPLAVMPMGGCTQASSTLTSLAWQPDLNTHSFAYLLTLDRGPSSYPACSLAQISRSYGRPNASIVVAGSFSHPREVLLFYDHGAHQSSPSTPQSPHGPANGVPISLDELPYTTCPVPTTMQIVAHQDDDLLFMNPDLLHDIRAGHCVRSVYITAGDSGYNKYYWLGREQGSESAYSTMLGTDQVWIERIVKLANNEFISVANPKANSRISLIFMHLPDGNLKGQGFAASHYQSLARLQEGKLSRLDAIYGGSNYTEAQLTDALKALMLAFQPTEIRTQSTFQGSKYFDHSDHMAVGHIVRQAYQQYELQQYENQIAVPIHYYLGYPTHELEANISGDDLAAKQAAFFAYARYDGGVCSNSLACIRDAAYGVYLTHQHQYPY